MYIVSDGTSASYTWLSRGMFVRGQRSNLGVLAPASEKFINARVAKRVI